MVVSADGTLLCLICTYLACRAQGKYTPTPSVHKLDNSLQMSNTCITSPIFAHADIRHGSTMVVTTGLILHCF